MNQLITTLPGTRPDPRYPDSNGRFMGDTEFHSDAIRLLADAIEDLFAGRNDVCVGVNLVFYWDEDNPQLRRDPDVLVATGVAGSHPRRSYRLWEEKKVPCTLFEIASKDTWRTDLRKKPDLYAGIGVKEYFLFDPEDRYLEPVLQGFKRVKGQPVAMKPAKDGSLVSKELGLRLVPEDSMLRLINLATGQPILTRAERAEQEHQRAVEAGERAEQEKELREQEHRRAEQEKVLREQEHLRAEQEKVLREQEHLRAEQEHQRAEALAAEVERLRQLLARRS